MPASLVVHLDIKPESLDSFVSIARAHGANCVTNEDGCLSFQVMLPQEEAGKVILVEVYRDDDAIESHLNSEHMAAYLEKTGEMIVHRQRYRCDLEV